MDKKITVKDFIKQCEESYFDIDIKEVIVNKYIPFRVKLNVSKRIIENHSLKNGDIKTSSISSMESRIDSPLSNGRIL